MADRAETCRCGQRSTSRGRCPACLERYYQQRHISPSSPSPSPSPRPRNSLPSPLSTVESTFTLPVRTRRPASRALEESFASDDGVSLFGSSSFKQHQQSHQHNRDFMNDSPGRRHSSSSSSTSSSSSSSPSSLRAGTPSPGRKRYSLIEEEQRSAFGNAASDPIATIASPPTSAPRSYSRDGARDRAAVGRGSLDAPRPRFDGERSYSPLSASFASLSSRRGGGSAEYGGGASSRQQSPMGRSGSGVELAAGMFGGVA